MQAGGGGLSHLTDTIDTAIQLLRIHLCHGQTAAAPRGGLQSELLRAGGAKCREGLCWCSRKHQRCGVVHLAYQRPMFAKSMAKRGGRKEGNHIMF